MTAESDAELVAAIRRGSRQAAATLANRYLRATRAVALSIVRDVDAAEDVAQDVFVYAIERIDDCRHPERFAGWLMRIARSRSHNHVRDRKDDRSSPLEAHSIPTAVAGPDREAERSEIRRRLLAALGEIPDDRGMVVLLHDLEGWTHREIADRLEIPPGTVRSHLHHARKRLRELLSDLRE